MPTYTNTASTHKLFILLSIVIFIIIPPCIPHGYAVGLSQRDGTDTAQDSLVQRALRYYSEGDYKRTITLNETADSISASAKLWYYKGMSYSALYDYPHAMEYFQKAIHRDSANVLYRFQYGRLLILSGYLERAADELSMCTLLDSTYLPAWYQLGLLYNMQGSDPDKECEIFSFLIRQNPDDFMSLYYLGDAVRRSGYSDSGAAFIKRSIAVNPQYYPSLIACGHYYDKKKEYAPALVYYKKALEIRPHDKDLLFKTGECLRKSGAPNEAVSYFKKAMAIDSTNDVVHAQLGYAYYSLGRFDSSVQAYAKAIALDDENADYYKNIALVYLKMDSVAAAIRMSKKRIEVLHPDDISFAYTSLATLYDSKNRSDDAVSMYKQNIAAACLDLAAYYRSNNKRADAITMYQRAIDFDPARHDILITMALLYEELNDNKSAIQIYQKMMRGLERYPDNPIKKHIEMLQKKVK